MNAQAFTDLNLSERTMGACFVPVAHAWLASWFIHQSQGGMNAALSQYLQSKIGVQDLDVYEYTSRCTRASSIVSVAAADTTPELSTLWQEIEGQLHVHSPSLEDAQAFKAVAGALSSSQPQGHIMQYAP
ncbi:hypothetical protein CONLIGDRAFT_687686 [Coniochaeta ligniaria NRRL 30616]|uniref:Uncharacterized protein n=1 Tax=Coniochaeta ligniaria NRRL 30616 TaxID=1408157 RepID=A0A1J7I3T1_9PEZI|nr:hypothetical protein CONLIGDRAFT_687686 [Coniochaeta ligniaria NRRL 30616]